MMKSLIQLPQPSLLFDNLPHSNGLEELDIRAFRFGCASTGGRSVSLMRIFNRPKQWTIAQQEVLQRKWAI